ncbi:unnamed protein product [Adineta steineri]|uniref:Peptidase S1 domain-containing protein n=1 Tax=Adineta steineri TaxID=433720 RepID=A0A816D4W9_9BILA|nr:unnamed protein product [Adineta steineri]CAF1630109.1 unnamed protein product [Adineta steineri]
MAYIYLLSIFFFLNNISCISSVTYSCDRNTECGCSKTNAQLNKIVGGESAVDSSWGWAVSLQRSSNNGHFCGGTIISPSYIITAAHCVQNVSFIIRSTKVVVGIDALSQIPSTTAQERSIVQVSSHPQYSAITKANDIAVLQLNQSLTISNEKGTARLCFPRVNATSMAYNYPISNSALVAIGWGVLRSGDQTIPSNLHLQQVTVNALPADHQMCASSINNRQLQFCAAVSGGGKDTCQGDSGGPLMYFESKERQWVLAGVTSYGYECGLPGYAGVYTRTSAYHSWLQSVVTDRVIELTVNGASDMLTVSGTSSTTTMNGASSTSKSLFWYILSLYMLVQIHVYFK